MMDAAEEIPPRVHPHKKPCASCGLQRHPLSLTSMAVSKVLDDDDLLIDILIRIALRTTLVRAALVCKRWLRHVSNRTFLRRFRELHPPRLLGFYNAVGSVWSDLYAPPRFVPVLPQPPELAYVVRCVASHDFGAYARLGIMDCRNASVFMWRREGTILTHGVHCPLCPMKGIDILPPLPSIQHVNHQILRAFLFKEEGGSLSCFYVFAEWTMETKEITVCVYMLQGSVWCVHTLATTQLPRLPSALQAVLIDDKIYMAATFIVDIIVLDLTASSFSRIPLPKGVKCSWFSTTLSCADDASGVYLTHVYVNELQLCIWLHSGDKWLLVDTICLRQMWAALRMLDHTLEDEVTDFQYISQVGDNAEFVLLEMCGCILYLDVTGRTLLKVDGVTVNDQDYSVVYPFMMIWPPIFPTLKDDLYIAPVEERSIKE